MCVPTEGIYSGISFICRLGKIANMTLAVLNWSLYFRRDPKLYLIAGSEVHTDLSEHLHDVSLIYCARIEHDLKAPNSPGIHQDSRISNASEFGHLEVTSDNVVVRISE